MYIEGILHICYLGKNSYVWMPKEEIKSASYPIIN